MKIITKCKSCGKEVRLKGYFNDRAELARKLGDFIELKCDNCNQEFKCHVNKIRAKESKKIRETALLIFIFGTVLIIYLTKDYLIDSSNSYFVYAFGVLLLVPSIIYMVVNRQEDENIRRFNQYWINE